MYSINNPQSQTGHYNFIVDSIKNLKPSSHDLVFEFGEIDLRAHVINLSRRQNTSTRDIVDSAIDSYFNFVIQFANQGFKIYISGPHCGEGKGMDGKLKDQEERNDLCRYMNRRLFEKCQENYFLFFSIFDIAVDLAIMRERANFYYDQIHLHLAPNKYGKLLNKIAEQRICTAHQDIKFYESMLDAKNSIVPLKVLASNLKGLSIPSILQQGRLKSPINIESKSKYYAVIEVPIPITNRYRFRLAFLKDKPAPTIKLFGIIENFDPTDYENKRNLVQFDNVTENANSNEIIFEVSKDKINKYKCSYLFMVFDCQFDTSLTSVTLG